jgi:AAA family ATP:ADP antiporter
VRSTSRSERLLRIFTDVRAGEGATALILFANVFLILCAYYLVKPLREGWIAISTFGELSPMEVKAYSSFGQSLILVGVVATYARWANRLPRASLITRATLFCMSNMLIFWLLQPDFLVGHSPVIGIAFFLWVGMFSVFVVAQFWAFVADVYEQERGDRLLPMIAIGATAGAYFGSKFVEQIALSEVAGVRQSLLLVALVPLFASILLTRWADRRGPLGEGGGAAEPRSAAGDGGGAGALSLVLGNRYLLAVGAITLLMGWVNTNGENVLTKVVQETLQGQATAAGLTSELEIREFRGAQTTAFYGNFYGWVNVIALLLQALVASRLLRFGGIALILLVMPAISLLSYGTMALLPILSVMKAMKIAENSTNYSINNTARHVVWLPVSGEMKYKGKPTVDTLFVRVGDGLAALTVFAVQFWALPTRAFLLFTVGLTLLWIAFCGVVSRLNLGLRSASGDAR